MRETEGLSAPFEPTKASGEKVERILRVLKPQEGLTHSARILYMVMMADAEQLDDGALVCIRTWPELSEMSGLSLSQIRRAIHMLSDNKYIGVKKRTDVKKGRSNYYVMY